MSDPTQDPPAAPRIPTPEEIKLAQAAAQRDAESVIREWEMSTIRTRLEREARRKLKRRR